MKGSAAQYAAQGHEASLQRTIALKRFHRILRTARSVTTGWSDVGRYDDFVKLDEANEYMVNKLCKLILHDYRG